MSKDSFCCTFGNAPNIYKHLGCWVVPMKIR